MIDRANIDFVVETHKERDAVYCAVSLYVNGIPEADIAKEMNFPEHVVGLLLKDHKREVAEEEQARKEVRAFYDDPSQQDNPFTRKEPRHPGIAYSAMPSKAVAHLHDLLGDMHACYNMQMEGQITTLAQAKVVIEDMHALLDEAMDVVRYTTFEQGEWENEQGEGEGEGEGEDKPDWLKD